MQKTNAYGLPETLCIDAPVGSGLPPTEIHTEKVAADCKVTLGKGVMHFVVFLHEDVAIPLIQYPDGLAGPSIKYLAELVKMIVGDPDAAAHQDLFRLHADHQCVTNFTVSINFDLNQYAVTSTTEYVPRIKNRLVDTWPADSQAVPMYRVVRVTVELDEFPENPLEMNDFPVEIYSGTRNYNLGTIGMKDDPVLTLIGVASSLLNLDGKSDDIVSLFNSGLVPEGDFICTVEDMLHEAFNDESDVWQRMAEDHEENASPLLPGKSKLIKPDGKADPSIDLFCEHHRIDSSLEGLWQLDLIGSTLGQHIAEEVIHKYAVAVPMFFKDYGGGSMDYYRGEVGDALYDDVHSYSGFAIIEYKDFAKWEGQAPSAVDLIGRCQRIFLSILDEYINYVNGNCWCVSVDEAWLEKSEYPDMTQETIDEYGPEHFDWESLENFSGFLGEEPDVDQVSLDLSSDVAKAVRAVGLGKPCLVN